MISQFYVNEPTEVIERVQQIEKLLDSEMFLAGLTANPPKYVGVFSRVSEIGYAFKMSSDQSIWDKPRPWPYEYFTAILEDELRIVPKQKLGVERAHAVFVRLGSRINGRSAHSMAGPPLREKIDQRVGNLVSVEQLERNTDKQKYPNLNLEYFVSKFLPNLIYGHFASFLQWAQYLPFEDGIKTEAYMSVYGLGGVPIGWVNDTQDIQSITDPEDEDYDEYWEDETQLGTPNACLNVLHFGSN